MRKKSNSLLYTSLLYIILGVLFVVFRSQTLEWAMTISGIVFILAGVLEVLKKNMVGGAVSLIIGLAIVILGWAAAQIVLLVLGILIAVKGLVALLDVIKSGRRSLPELLFPIISMVLGLMLAFGNALDIMIILVGVLLIVDGVIGLLGEKR